MIGSSSLLVTLATGAALTVGGLVLVGASGTAGAAGAATPAPHVRSAATAPHRLDTGNPAGRAFVPKAGRAVSVSHPNHVIGNGRPASCTSAKVVKAVHQGGVITFNCGPSPVTITMKATAKVENTSHRIVLDGGGLVTLSGGGKRRILYMNTCDQRQTWTTSHCQNQTLAVTRGAEHDLRRRQLPGRADRDLQLRRWRDLRPRRPAQGGQQQPSPTTAVTGSGPTSAAPRSGRWSSSTTARSTSPRTPSTAAAAPTAAR